MPQSFPETAARSAWEGWSQSPPAARVRPLCLHVFPPQPALLSAGVCATSSSLGSSLSSSAVQEPSLSGLACQAGTSPGCGPPGFMALISRQPDLDTAGSGSPVPMESATQEAAKPFLCARRKGALLACPGGQRESRALGLWESKRTNEAQQKKPRRKPELIRGREKKRAAIPRIICRCLKSVSPHHHLPPPHSDSRA